MIPVKSHQIGSLQMSPQYLKREKRQIQLTTIPVSLTCILCKTMEHIVFSQIMKPSRLQEGPEEFPTWI